MAKTQDQEKNTTLKVKLAYIIRENEQLKQKCQDQESITQELEESQRRQQEIQQKLEVTEKAPVELQDELAKTQKELWLLKSTLEETGVPVIKVNSVINEQNERSYTKPTKNVGNSLGTKRTVGAYGCPSFIGPVEGMNAQGTKNTEIEMQDVRGVLNTIIRKILPNITDCFFRDRSVEIVCVNMAETLKVEEMLK